MLYNATPIALTGLARCRMVYAQDLWLGDADRSQLPREETLRSLAVSLPVGQPVILDVEQWMTAPQFWSNASAQDVRRNICRLSILPRILRCERPDLQFGYYDILPTDNYGGANSDLFGRALDDVADSLALRTIAEAVDFVCPCAYVRTAMTVAQWDAWSMRFMKRARLYGKPVYPFLCPADAAGNLIDPAFLSHQVAVANKYADGAVIWASPATPAGPWQTGIQPFATGQ